MQKESASAELDSKLVSESLSANESVAASRLSLLSTSESDTKKDYESASNNFSQNSNLEDLHSEINQKQ
jgi:hypothetical protein